MIKRFFSVLVLISTGQAFAQENLINALASNKGADIQKYYQIKPVLALDATDVKNQGWSGTCWSYAGSSFLESEALKKKKKPVDLAEIYTARKIYLDKAINYVRMQGALNWGDGGEPHDVINSYRRYGVLPQSAYTGLINGATYNNFDEMQKDLKPYLEELVKMKKLPDNWKRKWTPT